MASAAFVTEFRSFIRFECEKSSTQYLNSKNFNDTDQRMAPLQEISRELEEKKIEEPLPMVRNHDSPPMARNQESPMSSPGTSGESSGSPESQPSERASDISSMVVYQAPSEESNGTENGSDHLKRMEGVLEKNGIFEQNPSCSYEADSDDELEPQKTYDFNESPTKIPVCHSCKFLAVSREEYDRHIRSHFPYKCAECRYMAKTKGRLENHMKNHRDVPDSWPNWNGQNGHEITENGALGLQEEDEPKGNKKNRVTRCKHCSFIGQSKSELYAHLRQRLCFTGPLLECDFRKTNGKRCDFCTHYKHHLEYHLRNHYESKPYKCRQCKYTCVNQSMLNSHMKSHSNDYPYRCKSCTYATKYLHSLKMHLQKYDHEPDHVLNTDGTVNTDIIIDVNGRRRGPKPKKAKASNSAINQGASTSSVSPPLHNPSHHSTSYNSNPSVSPLNAPFVYNNPLFSSPMFNNIARSGFYSPPFFDSPMAFRCSPPMDTNLRCNFPNCEFVADSSHTLIQHYSVHMLRNCQGTIGINPSRYQFGQDMQESGMFHFGSDNNVLDSHLQNRVENIPKKQGESSLQFHFRERAEVRAPGAFKLSPKVLNEMEIRREISPQINNGTMFQHHSYLRDKIKSINDMKKCHLDENLNRLGNGSRSSSLSPPSTEQAGASCCSSSSSGTCYDAEWDNTSPMDLTKNFPSTSKFCNGIDAESKPKSKHANPVCIQPQRPVKHRRKGKAFKIDQYMQCEDHSPEYTNSLLNMENTMQNHQSNGSDVKMEVEDLSLSPPRINGESQMPNHKCYPKSPERNSTPKRIHSSPQASFHVSSKQCSTPKVPTTATKDGHPLRNGFRETTQSGDESGFYSEDNKPGERNCGTLDVSLHHPSVSSCNGAPCSPPSTKPKDKKELKTNKQELTSNEESKDEQTCFHCKIRFADFVMLCMHMSFHTLGNPFQCQKCSKECNDRVGFMYHYLNECKRR